jgi:AraC-like DNA-binding protein
VNLRQKSVSGRIYRLMLYAAERQGFDRAKITRDIGIDEADIAASDARVSGDKHVVMLKLAETCMSRGSPPEGDVLHCLLSFPELAGVVCNSPTLRDALRNYVEYRDLIGNVDWLVMHEQGDEVEFEYVLEGEGRNASSALGNFALIASVARLYDARPRVRDAGITDARMSAVPVLSDALSVRVQLDQARNRMVLQSSALDRAFEVYNAPLSKIHVHAAHDMLQRIREQGRFSPTVERCLRDVLREQVDAIEPKSLQALVCERLALTRWTLQRKLAAERKTFSEVLTQTRIDEARTLLAHTPMSITEISERVGFASTTAFTRFFTRACGAPPARYRGRQRGATRPMARMMEPAMAAAQAETAESDTSRGRPETRAPADANFTGLRYLPLVASSTFITSAAVCSECSRSNRERHAPSRLDSASNISLCSPRDSLQRSTSALAAPLARWILLINEAYRSDSTELPATSTIC